MGSNETHYSSKRAIKFAVVVSLLLVAFVVTDLFLTTHTKPSVSLDSARLSFEGSATSDATLTFPGGLKANAGFHSVEMTACNCELQFNENGQQENWLDVGSILGTSTPAADGTNGRSLSVEFQNTNFASLRRLLYATSLNRPLGASMHCAVDTNAYMYGTVTVPSRFMIDVKMLAPTSEVANVIVTTSAHWAGKKLYESVSSSQIDRASMELGDIMSILQSLNAGNSFHHSMPDSWNSVMGMFDHSKPKEIHLDATVKNPFFEAVSLYPLSSFVVVVPALTVATTALGDEDHGGRFVVSSIAFELELVQPTLHLQSDVKLQCSDSYISGETPAVLNNCAMPGPSELFNIYHKLSLNRVHMSMDIVNHNFVTKLIGSHHSFQSEAIDVSAVNAQLEQRMSAARARSAASTGLIPLSHAAAQVALMSTDVTARVSCTQMDTDGVFTFFMCTEESPTSIDFRAYLLDETEILMGTTLLSAWSADGPLEMRTEVQVKALEGRYLAFNNTISESAGLFRAALAYHEKGESRLNVDTMVHWEWNGSGDTLQRLEMRGRIDGLDLGFDLSLVNGKINGAAHANELSTTVKGDYTITNAWNWYI